jgi:hypothetical protein
LKSYLILGCCLIFGGPVIGQTTTGAAETKGKCSPAVTGNSNKLTINCSGVTKEQLDRMSEILNKILFNQLNPQDVMAKLDEILHAVNPNKPNKVYWCNGTYRIVGPSATSAIDVEIGGDTSAAVRMDTLLKANDFDGLINACSEYRKTMPEWLTPNLFCAAAYYSKQNIQKAKEFLKDYDSRKGATYDACESFANQLHSRIDSVK